MKEAVKNKYSEIKDQIQEMNLEQYEDPNELDEYSEVKELLLEDLKPLIINVKAFEGLIREEIKKEETVKPKIKEAVAIFETLEDTFERHSKRVKEQKKTVDFFASLNAWKSKTETLQDSINDVEAEMKEVTSKIAHKKKRIAAALKGDKADEMIDDLKNSFNSEISLHDKNLILKMNGLDKDVLFFEAIRKSLVAITEKMEALKEKQKDIFSFFSSSSETLSALTDKDWQQRFGENWNAAKTSWESKKTKIQNACGILEDGLDDLDKESSEYLETDPKQIRDFFKYISRYEGTFHPKADSVATRQEKLFHIINKLLLPLLSSGKRGVNLDIELAGLIKELDEPLKDIEDDSETAAFSDRIYELRTSFDQQTAWLQSRVGVFSDFINKGLLKDGYKRRMGDHRTKSSKFIQESDLYKRFKDQGIIDDIEWVVEDLEEGVGELFNSKEAARKDVGDNKKETLDKLLEYKKEFDAEFLILKRMYESVYPKVQASEFAAMMPEKPYTAELPPEIDPKQLVSKGGTGDSGAFGSITKIIHKGDKREVFKFKTMNFGENDDLREKRRDLEREVSMYERVGEHPNIMKCYGIISMNGQQGMLMEDMDGGDLHDNFDKLNKLWETGKVSDEEYMGFMQHSMKGSLQGLAHMHKMGFSHIDIKPGNIMMKSDGTVKLIDLGISEKSGTLADVVPDDVIHRDPHFGNDGIAMPYSDIFSIGLSLYQKKNIYAFKADENVNKVFFYGVPGDKWLYKLFDLGKKWVKYTGNRVFKAMPEKDKKTMEKEIEMARKWYVEKGEKIQDKVRTVEGKIGVTENELEEATEEARESMRELVEESNEKINAIRKKYLTYSGATFINQYMDFMNKIMHPDPSQRLSALEALDHPFLTEAFVQDESEAQKILFKLNPELANPIVEEIGDDEPTIDTASVEMSPLVSQEKKDELKERMVGDLSKREDALQHVRDMAGQTFEGERRELLNQWIKTAKKTKKDPAIKELMAIQKKFPPLSKVSRAVLDQTISELDNFWQISENRLNELKLRQEEVGSLSKKETKVQSAIESLKEWLNDTLSSLDELKLTIKTWEQAHKGEDPLIS